MKGAQFWFWGGNIVYVQLLNYAKYSLSYSLKLV